MIYENFIQRFDKVTTTARGVMARCPSHDDNKHSLSVGRAKDGGVVLKCFAGCETEDVVKAMGLEMRDLFAVSKNGRRNGAVAKPAVKEELAPKKQSVEDVPKIKPAIEKIYSYTDALGRELFQAIRLKPKDFRQRHRSENGWLWNMDGVERVLYRLPEVMKADVVWIVEGEKDADNLASLGYTATTNVGGAKKWLDGYSSALKGKQIIICGDNDKPGQEHAQMVFDSVSEKAACVKLLQVPNFKDISDFISSFNSTTEAKKAIDELVSDCTPHHGGVRLPIYSMADLAPRHHRLVVRSAELCVDLGNWLPSFKNVIRPLTPGSVAMFVGDTGIGKTNLLQNIAMKFSQHPTLFFEMELPDEDLYERFWANKQNITGAEFEESVREFGCHSPQEVMAAFPNLFICPETKLTLDALEKILFKSELKMGRKPVIVMLDYIQLLKGEGHTRYERASNVAEGVKTLAKATQTIMIMASQVDRASGKEGIVGLHSAKDTGSLENSAQLVVACKRDQKDRTLLNLRVIKANKGGAGTEVDCEFDGARSTITERAKKGDGN